MEDARASGVGNAAAIDAPLNCGTVGAVEELSIQDVDGGTLLDWSGGVAAVSIEAAILVTSYYNT